MDNFLQYFHLLLASVAAFIVALLSILERVDLFTFSFRVALTIVIFYIFGKLIKNRMIKLFVMDKRQREKTNSVKIDEKTEKSDIMEEGTVENDSDFDEFNEI